MRSFPAANTAFSVYILKAVRLMPWRERPTRMIARRTIGWQPAQAPEQRLEQTNRHQQPYKEASQKAYRWLSFARRQQQRAITATMLTTYLPPFLLGIALGAESAVDLARR